MGVLRKLEAEAGRLMGVRLPAWFLLRMDVSLSCFWR
jgi:hypothetical protein